MDKRQWRILVIGFLVLMVIVVSITFFINNKDRHKEAVEEAIKEEEKTQKNTKKEVDALLGIDYELLTWSEMGIAVDKVKEEHEDYTEEEVGKYIGEVFGKLNEISYMYDRVLDDAASKNDRRQVINEILNVGYLTGYLDVEDIMAINVIPTKTVLGYKNSVQDVDISREYTNKNVIGEGAEWDILMTDTDGFIKGESHKVGYPVVSAVPIGNSGKVEVGIDVFIEEDIKLEKFKDNVKKMEVVVGDTKADLLSTTTLETEIKEYLESSDDVEIDKRDRFLDIHTKYLEHNYLADIYTKPMGVYYSKFSDSEGMSIDDLLNGEEELTKFMDNLDSKTLMGGTFTTVYYEVDTDKIFGNIDIYETDYKDIKEILKKSNELPVITVDGLDMQLNIIDEKEKVKYKK